MLGLNRDSLGRAALALALGLAGCVHVRCPENGGAPWREVTSQHFAIKTDLKPPQAHEILRGLERYRMALVQALRLPVDPPGRLSGVFVSDDRIFRALHMGSDVHGFMTRDPMIVAWIPPFRDWMYRPDFIHIHELTHYLAQFWLRNPPRWLHEGLATHLETLRVSDAGDLAIIGQQPEYHTSFLRWGPKPLSIEALWSWPEDDPDQETTHLRYASSWLLVRLLQKEEPSSFQAFLGRLAAGEEPRTAWKAEFSDAKVVQLNLRMKQLPREPADDGAHQQLHLQPAECLLTERTMSGAQFHDMLAELWRTAPSDLTTPERVARRRVELAKALRHDSNDLEARLARIAATNDRKARESDAKELVGAHPEDARAWLALAGAMEAGEERDAAFERTARLGGENPRVLNSVAWSYVEQGRAAKALALAERAAALQPWSSAIIDTLAAALALSGRCNEALAQQTAAVNLLSEAAAKAEHNAAMFKRLEQYRAGCVEKPFIPPPE